MRSRPLVLMVALALGAAYPRTARGQGVELGLDAEFDYITNDPGVTSISIPNGSLRAGFRLNQNISFEPRISFLHASANGNSATNLSLQLGFPWQLTAGRARSTVYFRPFLDYVRLSAGGGSASQTAVGGGIGYKIPQGDRLAIRLEAGLQHSLENDNFASADTIFGLLGISFYTK